MSSLPPPPPDADPIFTRWVYLLWEKVTAAVGGGNSPIFGNIPKSTTTSGTLTAVENGYVIPMTGSVTINPNVFAEGNTVSFYNTTSGNLSITQGSGMVLHLSGTATTGTRTLAQRGLATLWFDSATSGVISGAGLT